MPDDHHHSEYATHHEVNGFGERLNRVESSQAEERTKTGRNEEDIQVLFQMSKDNTAAIGNLATKTAESIAEVELSVSNSVAEVKQNVAKMVGKISGAVAVISGGILLLAEIVKYFLGR